MAIDYVIDWPCVPKEALSTPGILARLKARERAGAIIQLYRDHGDERTPAEMGFEMARRLPNGEEEVRIVIVQELIDEATELEPFTEHCIGCPANRAGQAFGCFGAINYPISQAAEFWLLKRLPAPEEPLPFLLLREVLSESPQLGQQAAQMRGAAGIIFESSDTFARRVEDFQVTTNHIFELLFLVSAILPTYSALLMLFFGIIQRDMDADVLKSLTPAPADWQTRFPFQLTLDEQDEQDDGSIIALKNFFAALYLAYGLDVPLSLDV